MIWSFSLAWPTGDLVSKKSWSTLIYYSGVYSLIAALIYLPNLQLSEQKNFRSD